MIKRFFLMALLSPALLFGHVYHHVAQQILETIPVDINTPGEDELLHEDRLYFMEPNLSYHEQVALATTILSSHASKSDNQKAYATGISPETARDLQLLTTHSKKESETVLSRIARTQSLFGRLVLARLLLQPTTNTMVLKQRQAAITFLLTHPTLANQLRQLIAAFAEHEAALLSLWNNRDLLFGKNVRESFYNNDLTQEHTAASLESQRLKSDALLVASPLLYYVLAEILCRLGVDGAQILQKIFLFQDVPPPGPGDTQKVASKMFSKLFTLLMLLSDGRRQLTRCLNRVDIVQHLRTRLSPLVRYARLTNMAGSLLKAEPQLAALLPELTPLHDAAYHNKEQQIFLDNLTSKSFMSTSYFTTVGPVLAALPDFLKLRHTFGSTLEALGTLDAYLSIAKLYQEHDDLPGTYCFPTYVQNAGSSTSEDDRPESEETPELNITHLWHPLLSGKTAILNDANFGNKKPSYMVLTGPNAAGKSTYLKAVVVNILLGQTIGIMPAQSARFTPCDTIETYLTIVDDIGNHKSLFKAEAVRAHQLLNSIASLPPDQHALIALDEMFCGTSPRVGQAMAYALTHLLRQQKNCTGLIATHFSKLTEIPQLHPLEYRNAHFKAFKQSDGSFYYPYTLHEGASSQMIALDLLAHEGFDEQLLAYAYQHLETLLGQ